MTGHPDQHQPGRRPPNIILVLTDDLGYSDIAPYGGIFETPALSQMAREGFLSTGYYSPANICTPARAGILTGRYPLRTGLGFEVIMQGDDRALPRSEVTIAAALKPVYATGLFGKWHLGHRAPDWLPTTYGFDRFVGIPYSHDMAPLSIFAANAGEAASEYNLPFEALQEEFYTQAERFIEANRTRPFFIELALSAPHLPNHPPEALLGKSRVGPYGDSILEIDAIMGRLFAKLDALDLGRDTLVIFTSDNGPWFEGSSLPLRDRKGGAGYDGGYRVPFLALWPGQIPPGQRSNAIVCGINLLPTFCAVAGVALPDRVEIDGRDISGVLLRGAPSPHEQLLLFNNFEVVAVRTQRWKYVSETYYRGWRVPLARWGHEELYDMSASDSESYSLARYEPVVLADMQRRLAAARAEFKAYNTGIPDYFRTLSAQLKQRQD